AAKDVAALGERIDQPSGGVQVGVLADYECLCLGNPPAANPCPNNCPAARNQINAVGTNCIDAAIATKSTTANVLDILDVGTPAAFTPSKPSTLACPTALTADAMDRIVVKSGAASGLTCGKVTDAAFTTVTDGSKTFIDQFKVEPISDGA